MKNTTVEELSRVLGQGDWPLIEDLELGSQQLTLLLKVPEKLEAFKGHFPEQAVLPGIIQIHWAAEIGRLIFQAKDSDATAADFSALRGVKFNGMVMPGQKLKLSLRYNAESKKIKFEYSDAQQKYSNGIIESSGTGQ